MGKIIKFSKNNENIDSTEMSIKKKCFIKKYVVLLVTIVTTFCTVTGITVLTLLEKDWQKIVEQYNNAGLELYNLGEYEDAIVLYDKAINLESKNIEGIEVCYYNRGRAYFKLESYQKAIGDYTKAIEISPQTKYYSERAIVYEMIGETEKAALDNIRAFTAIIDWNKYLSAIKNKTMTDIFLLFYRKTPETNLSKYSQYIAIPVICSRNKYLGVLQITTK